MILAIEPGDRSGWALFVRGVPKMGDVRDSLSADAVRPVVWLAVGLADQLELPCVLVLGRRRWSSPAARERWQAAWRKLGDRVGAVIDVRRSEYQAAVLGERFVAPMVGSIGREETAAVCIGKWASHARAVGLVLGKRVVRRAPTKLVEVSDGR